MASRDRLVPMGRVAGVFGVQGWIKVFSYTEPREGILEYGPWRLQSGDGTWREYPVIEGRRQGQGVVAALEGVTDREAAHALIDSEIAVPRDRLPPPSGDEYYWTDLEGMRVVNLAGVELGSVDHLIRTGANDVLVVDGDRQHLVPFVRDEFVRDVDFDSGVIRVDWDETF